MYYCNHKYIHFIETSICKIFSFNSIHNFKTYDTYHHIISRLHLLLLLHQIIQHQKSHQVHIGLSINTK